MRPFPFLRPALASAEPAFELVARGGFSNPTIDYGEVTGGIIAPTRPIRDLLPAFSAWRSHFFGDPALRWAHEREQQLRDERLAREAEAEVAAAEWPYEYPTYRRADW